MIPANVNHPVSGICGIGNGLKIKVNANIGTSSDVGTIAGELEKLQVSIKYGADTVMDLSTGGDIRKVRRAILKQSSVPIGTVPIYQAMIEAGEKYGPIVKATADDIFKAIEEQAAEGVDFITVHCGVTQSAVKSLKSQRRVTDVVSRGGAFLLGWMLYHEKENPLYENYDRLLDIARKYDVTLSLGDGMRPGSLADATDRPQIQELITLGELVERAWKAGVQVMVEGPGHLPLNHIGMNMQLQKSLCKGAPFYVLGPLVTDIGAGYDHITSAIGGAIAGAYGADFLCYVTPAEHLSLPDIRGRQKRGNCLTYSRSRGRYHQEPGQSRGLGPEDVHRPQAPGLGSPGRSIHRSRKGQGNPVQICGEGARLQHVRGVLRHGPG